MLTLRAVAATGEALLAAGAPGPSPAVDARLAAAARAAIALGGSVAIGAVVALVRERGFSRLPVFHERLFNTLGSVSSFDLLGVDPALPVTTVMRDPFFVPETKPLPELLATLQAERLPLALVVDEYGG